MAARRSVEELDAELSKIDPKILTQTERERLWDQLQLWVASNCGHLSPQEQATTTARLCGRIVGREEVIE